MSLASAPSHAGPVALRRLSRDARRRLGATRRPAPSAPPGCGARPAVQPADDLALPAFDARLLARRLVIPAVLAAIVVVAVVASGAPVEALTDALARALAADPRWVAAAAVFELLSFTGYIAVLWLVARRATARIGLRESAQVTLGGAAATRLLPAAGLGGVAMTLWALRKAGLGAREASRTLLAQLVLVYSVFLGAIAVAGGSLALGVSEADGPTTLSALPAAVATAAMLLAVIVALTVSPEPRALEGNNRRIARRGRLTEAAGTFSGAVRDAAGLLRGADVRLLGAAAWWTFDAAVLWAMLHALGTPPALSVVVLGYFVGQVANTLPIPGSVSGGMVGVLLAFGVALDLALGAVLAYRAVAIWLPTPIGLLALRGLRRTVATWSREDAVARERMAPALACA